MRFVFILSIVQFRFELQMVSTRFLGCVSVHTSRCVTDISRSGEAKLSNAPIESIFGCACSPGALRCINDFVTEYEGV